MITWKTRCTLHGHVQPRHVPTCIVTDISVTHHSLKMNFNPQRHFNDHLLSAVENAKLDRPIDSTPPLSRSVYVTQEADWGDQWGYDQAYHTDTWYDNSWQEEEYPSYPVEYEDQIEEDDPDIDINDDLDLDESEEGMRHDCHLLEDGDSSGEEDEGYE